MVRHTNRIRNILFQITKNDEALRPTHPPLTRWTNTCCNLDGSSSIPRGFCTPWAFVNFPGKRGMTLWLCDALFSKKICLLSAPLLLTSEATFANCKAAGTMRLRTFATRSLAACFHNLPSLVHWKKPWANNLPPGSETQTYNSQAGELLKSWKDSSAKESGHHQRNRYQVPDTGRPTAAWTLSLAQGVFVNCPLEKSMPLWTALIWHEPNQTRPDQPFFKP